MNSKPGRKLREIILRDNSLLREDPQRLIGFLKDACPDYKRETSIL